LNITRLPFRARLEEYQNQAVTLLRAWKERDADAVRMVRETHPRFLRADVPWLSKPLTDDELRHTEIDTDDAQLAIARWYDFGDWPSLVAYVEAVSDEHSEAFRFESAVEAVIDGGEATLRSLLHDHPDLVRARSTRVTHFDPPAHRATLLHYIAANGVEGYRQKTPPNAVEVARMLLEAGSDADALADMYGGRHATLSMLVSSGHPARAGLQVALTETLLDFGARVDGSGTGDWTSPLMTALAFGYLDTAQALVRRGARVDSLAAAAGLGRLDDARMLVAGSSGEDRHRAMALAAQHGHAEIVRLLLDAGEDPNRYNPKGNHAHSTPLHQAALSGQEKVVRLLVERGARLDIKDTIYQSTALGWARYGRRDDIAEYLRSRGAPD
jgi:ankyrin repeat protein